MTASNEARIRVIIVADDRTTRKVSELLRQLDIRSKIADRPRSRTDGVLHCFTAKSVPVPLFPPAIVINTGEFVSDRVVQAVATRGICAIAFEDLSSQALLHAIVRSTLGVGLEALETHVLSVPQFAHIPVELLAAFLETPRRFHRLSDISGALTISDSSARTVVKNAGFERAEHLLAALRATAWSWFAKERVDRQAFEDYLGISNRATFRRACFRAGIEPPWRQTAP